MTAAARHVDPNTLLYASRALLSGHGYQGASQVSGLPEVLLRSEFPGHRQKQTMSVVALPSAPRLATAHDVIKALAGLSHEDVKAVHQHCASMLGLIGKRRLFGSEIRDIVADHFELTPDDMTGRSQYLVVARPRQIACFLIREYRPDMSLPAIGRIMGGRDHTTILHGIRTITAMVDSSPEISASVAAIRKVIEAYISDGVTG